MTILDIAAYILRPLAAVLAVIVAGRRREHIPVAFFLCAIVVADLLHWWINTDLLASAPRPYTGWNRVLFHVTEALFISWSFGSLAVAWLVFLRRRPVVPVIAYVLALAVLTIGYPWPFRQQVLGVAQAVIHAVTVLASLACAAVWVRRGPARPYIEHASVLLIAVVGLGIFWGPYFPRSFEPFDAWPLAQLTDITLYIFLVAVHGAALWRGLLLPQSPRSSAPRSG